MSYFMNNPFISQKKKDAIGEFERALFDTYFDKPPGLEIVLDRMVRVFVEHLPKILEAWTEKDCE